MKSRFTYPYKGKSPPCQPFWPFYFSSKKKAPKRITMKTADSVIVVNQTFCVTN